MTSFSLGILLVLLAPMFAVGIAFTWLRSDKKALMSAVVASLVAFMYFGYRIGRADGEDVYFHRLRTEMNPFLRDLHVASDAKRAAAMNDFFIRADDGKLMAGDYINDLKDARKLLAKAPNKALEPTTTSVTSPAAQETRQP